MRTLRVLLLAATASFSLAGAAGGAAPPAYSFKQVSSAFVDPVFATSAPGAAGTLYVVEQAGTIRTFANGRVTGVFLDIRDQVRSGGEYGLLSLAFHPGYAQNHLFYVDYTDLQGNTRVVEYASANGVAVPSSARVLLSVEQPYPNHKGGQLAFDRQGYLYVGMGDGGTNPNETFGDPENHAQDLQSRLGKLLRIKPTDPNAVWETVGYGLRNPWRFSFDRLTGDLWIGDLGAGRFEEIDYRPRALVGALVNYGWSRYEGPYLYNANVQLAPGGPLVRPAWFYAHSNGSPTNCGVIGGYVYRGSRVPAARGRYFFGDLCSGLIWSFKVGKGGRTSSATTVEGRVADLSSFGENTQGELYAVGLSGVLAVLR